MDKQAIVILRNLSGDVSHAERRIILDPNHLTTPIGRASKTLSKGIVAGTHNAWFDSPVMSRDHAQMCLNPNTNVVTIHDIGSMHGTFVNQKQLPLEQPTRISDGDEIIFGAEVRRGLEVFPACAFRVKLEMIPYTAPNSYTFPESSDIEAEEDNILSDNAMDDEDPATSDDDTSIEFQSPVKISRAVDPIDLTRDESPMDSSLDRTDLTDESPGKNFTNKHKHSMGSAAYSKEPIVVESEDEEDNHEHFEVSNKQSIIAESSDSDSFPDDEAPGFGDAESVGNAESEDLESVPNESLGNEFSSMAKAIDGVDHYVGQEQSLSFPALDTQGTIEASQKLVDDDDESDFGLSDAGAEGIRALFGDGLLHSEFDGSERSSIKDMHLHYEQQATEATRNTISLEQTLDGKPVSLPCDTTTPNTPAGLTAAFNQRSVVARQPSPSDAAMVKTAPIHAGPQQTASGVPVLHSQEKPCSWLSQTLGEKTGKRAFFEARENNKAKVHASLGNDDETPAPPSLSSSKDFLVNTQGPKDAHIPRFGISNLIAIDKRANSAKGAELPNVASSSSNTEATAFNVASTTARPSLEFNSHYQPPSLRRAVSPEYDMTSAVKFNESKAKSVRSRLSLVKIMDSPRRDHSDQIDGSKIGEKRKLSDISNVIDQELREWASLGASKPSEVVCSSSEAENSNQLVIPTGVLVPETDEQPPAKKIKTILERAAYAAVGGVAVGVGLFFSLVATAPDFA